MSLRNFVFKIGNQIQNLAARRSLAYLNQIESSTASSSAVINQKEQVIQVQREIENVANVIRNSIPESEKPEFEILKNFYFNGQYDNRVDASDVLLQLDRIQVLKNLKLIEESQGQYDPELIRVEKLKARVLLEEEGAAAEYLAYLANRPYYKAYEKWAVNEETVKQQVLG